MRHNKITFPILPPPRGGRIRGGGEASPLTPTLSSFGKLRTVSLSNPHGGEREIIEWTYHRVRDDSDGTTLYPWIPDHGFAMSGMTD